ncbi:isochorismatase family protein [Pseudomonas sp. MYb118]|uniref:isochorismatase family protein n=1 Tax=Pseudomonas sp. MYb118 TaxID=1848720 RepID=UPI0034CD37FD
MSAQKTALIVIDVQESFRAAPYWNEDSLPTFLSHLQPLIDGAKAAGIPVLQVFHAEGTGPFSEASGLVKTMEPLNIAPDAIFKKPRHSALVGSGLDVWLNTHGIRRVIISGIRTEQCCETTARHAYDLGYNVDFVSEATLTFPMTDEAGREWSADELHARTKLVLSGRFVRVATVKEALAGAAEALPSPGGTAVA